MAEITHAGAPSKYTVGAIGDTYTDSITGTQYICKGIYHSSTYHGQETTYEWDEIETSGSGSGGSDGHTHSNKGVLDRLNQNSAGNLTFGGSEIKGGAGEPGKDGITPHIGTNGNWFIGDTDTGVAAAGKDGKDGAQGIQGPQGESAVSAINPRGDYSASADPAYSVGDYITHTDGNTYVCKADNPSNTAPTDGTSSDPFWQLIALRGATGPQGNPGVDGKDGVDGINGAAGKDGVDGVGISKIEKIGTEGLVDTYRITFTDNTTFDYTVTNGADGEGGSGESITISEEVGNAIETKEDGIYVADKSAEIAKIQNDLAPITKYQKYVNTELDSCYCGLTSNYTPVVGEYVPFERTSGTFEVANGRVKVKPGQRVQINVVISYIGSTSAGNMVLYVKDYTNDVAIACVQPSDGADIHEYADNIACQYSNETDHMCELGLYVDTIYTGDNICAQGTVFTVQEINRAITIDPLNYVNENQGIEDAPVGHIISYMGNNAPDHYIPCDGAEYNIADYPYLAQHMIDQFGTVNHFGGDGTTTFAVPIRKDTVPSNEYFPNMTGDNNEATSYIASASTTHGDMTPYNAFSDNDLIWHSTSENNPWIMLDCGSNKDICQVKITARHDDSTFYPWTNFKILGSNDGVEFVELQYYANVSWSMGLEKTFRFDEVYSYRYYKFQHMTAGYTALKQIKLYEPSAEYYIKYEPTYFMVHKDYNTNYLQPTLYSEEERVVGCWIDGKPLYEKTINFTSGPNASSDVLIYDAAQDNLEELINVYGYVERILSDNKHATIPIPGSQGWAYLYSDTKIWVGLSSSAAGGYSMPGYLTIQYTKTTDAEDSFTTQMITDYAVAGYNNTVFPDYTNEIAKITTAGATYTATENCVVTGYTQTASSGEWGRVYVDGISVHVCGAPNVGEGHTVFFYMKAGQVLTTRSGSTTYDLTIYGLQS